MNKNLLYAVGTGIVFLALAFMIARAVAPTNDMALKGNVMQGTTYVTSGGFTMATTTVNTTSTQIFASVNQLTIVTNNTTSTITCNLDARNTTAASSTVTSTRGIIIGPNNGTIIPAKVQFGQCAPGGIDCFPHSGALNCVANTAATVIVATQ